MFYDCKMLELVNNTLVARCATFYSFLKVQTILVARCATFWALFLKKC